MFITSTGRPIYLLFTSKPVMNGSTDLTVPSLLILTSAMSPPNLTVLFHEPWRDENLVAIFGREHMPGVELHAKRRGMWPHQRNRRGEITAFVAPAEVDVRHITLMAIRLAEILTDFGDAIKFVVRPIFRQPIAAVVGEVELFVARIPVKADGVADAVGDDLGTAAVKVNAAKLAMIFVVQHVVGRLADLKIELIVRADRQVLLAVRLVLRQIVVDHHWFRRSVNLVVDVLDLRNLR